MLNKPVFGICLTLIAYYVGLKIKERFSSPIVSPMLVAIIICIGVITLTGATYDQYMLGGAYIAFLVSLATVSLAVPFYKNLHVFLRYKKAIIIGSCMGALTSMVSILVLGKVLGLDGSLIVSLFPKSVTTAIGSPLSDMYGGSYSITAVSISLTGILGSMIFEKCFSVLGIDQDLAMGTALGTSSHAMGTSCALTMSEKAGAISGVCIVIAGLFTVLAMPIMVRLI